MVRDHAGVWVGLEILQEMKSGVKGRAGVWVGSEGQQEEKGMVKDLAGLWAGLKVLQEWKGVVRDSKGEEGCGYGRNATIQLNISYFQQKQLFVLDLHYSACFDP